MMKRGQLASFARRYRAKIERFNGNGLEELGDSNEKLEMRSR